VTKTVFRLSGIKSGWYKLGDLMYKKAHLLRIKCQVRAKGRHTVVYSST